jgi:phosphatidate cytidylyltransferase
VATAAVGLPIVGAVAWVGGWPFALVAAAIALLAATEFVHGWLLPSMPVTAALPQLPTYGAAAVMVGGTHADWRFLVLGVVFAALFALAGYSHTNALGPRRPFRVYSWCLVYLGLLLSTLVLVRDADDGRRWFFLGILTTFAIDTGAYAVGKLIGRHKMAPKISPGKTWEGAIGGYVAGAGACFALNGLLDGGTSAVGVAPLAFALPPVAIAGDLFESWMKRRMGVKDASGLLPGHGGFLDRLDSILFVFPVLYLFLRLRVL